MINMTRYWGVRLGEGGAYVEDGKKGNYIAIGWNELGNLDWLSREKDPYSTKSFQKISKIYDEVYGGSKMSQSIAIGQIVRFVNEMNKEDIVLVPNPEKRTVIIGRVVGNYSYKEDWGDLCDYAHRRRVNWIKTVGRDDLPQKLKYSIGALLTIFSLDPHKDSINELIHPSKVTPSRPAEFEIISGEHLTDVIINRLYDLSPRDFEHLARDILSQVGFEAVTTEYVGDAGVDVIGELNAKGLAQVTLRIQVKRRKGSVGIEEVQRLRGTLDPGEHGAIITTSHFTKKAHEEAQARGKPIALIDKEMLAGLILEYYENLNDKYKKILRLKKKEISLADMFYATTVRP